MLRNKLALLSLPIFCFSMIALPACEEEGPYEQQGEMIEERGDEYEERTDEIEDDLEDMDDERYIDPATPPPGEPVTPPPPPPTGG